MIVIYLSVANILRISSVSSSLTDVERCRQLGFIKPVAMPDGCYQSKPSSESYVTVSPRNSSYEAWILRVSYSREVPDGHDMSSSGHRPEHHNRPRTLHGLPCGPYPLHAQPPWGLEMLIMPPSAVSSGVLQVGRHAGRHCYHEAAQRLSSFTVRYARPGGQQAGGCAGRRLNPHRWALLSSAPARALI